jgi:mannonate dehydratase
MAMEQTWRWFGPNDPVTLKDVKQTGATGIVTALHQVPIGEVWNREEIRERKQAIEAEGLTWSVVESVPVHEDIKKRSGDYQRYIRNFAESVRNLGAEGIPTLCYNFMPVLDWSRTSLEGVFSDGSIMTRFDPVTFATFDVFILKRPGAAKDYHPDQVAEARRWYEASDGAAQKKLTDTILLGLPGSFESYSLDRFRDALAAYNGIDAEKLRDNLRLFLKEVVPVAKESGVFMAIHPDDPPFPLLGLPRVVSSASDVQSLLGAVDTPENGLTLCTGSFGAGVQNDLVDMAQRFSSRINFIHLRNVTKNPEGGFFEDNHLDGDIDMFGVITAILKEQQRRKAEGRKDDRMPMRPDHGHMMLADLELAEYRKKKTYPGYSLVGRMRGLAELRGLELGIRRALKL